MRAFENWNDVKPMLGGESQRLPAGGYVCRINSATETISKTQKRMLEVKFDIAEGDYKDYYMNKYKNSKPKNDTDIIKWKGMYYIVLEGENAEARLKGFITVLEESNPSFIWDWDESKLRGLLFGGVFGEEEFEGDTGVITTTKLSFVRNIEAIRKGDYKIPAPKLLEKANAPFSGSTNNNSVTDDDLPF